MKIGIVTFWDSGDNYGQQMQCFALQRYLCNKGYDAELIRYKEKNLHKVGLSVLKKLSPSYILKYLKYRRSQHHATPGDVRNFSDFRNRFIRQSDEVYYGYDDLWDRACNYDVLICGSDQIWSPRDVDLRPYFLQFAPKTIKKVSYAASFGCDTLPPDYDLAARLSDFDAVSVRELSGLTLCRQAARDDVRLVCDPTLLLCQADYMRALGLELTHSDDVKPFVYFINWPTDFPRGGIESLIEISAPYAYFSTLGTSFLNLEPAENLGVLSWIKNITSADRVYTNSFHGVVFSLIFHKRFVVFPLSGDAACMNGRLTSLLERVGLTDRIYSQGMDVDTVMNRRIDWDDVEERLSEFRSESQMFLADALADSKEEVYKENILFLSNGAIHHRYGGLDRVTEDLSTYFKSHGHKVYYLSFTRRPESHEDIQYYFPDDKELFSTANKKYLNDFVRRHGITAIINQEGNVDFAFDLDDNMSSVVRLSVLHFAPNYVVDNYFANKFRYRSGSRLSDRIMGLLFRIPFVNNIGLKYLRSKLRSHYVRQVDKCDEYVLLSNRFRQQFAEISNKRPMNVSAINNPLSPGCYSHIDLKQKDNRVLYIGRLDCELKQVDKLLGVWSAVSAEFPDWRFDIVGDGPHRQLLEDMIKSQNISNLTIHGYAEVGSYYQKGAILLFPATSFEGWGLILVEAQAHGCVPVAFDAYPSIRDIINDGVNGVLLQPDKFDALAEALRSLMADPSLRNRLARGAMDSVSRFSLGTIGPQWLRLIALTRCKLSR